MNDHPRMEQRILEAFDVTPEEMKAAREWTGGGAYQHALRHKVEMQQVLDHWQGDIEQMIETGNCPEHRRNVTAGCAHCDFLARWREDLHRSKDESHGDPDTCKEA